MTNPDIMTVQELEDFLGENPPHFHLQLGNMKEGLCLVVTDPEKPRDVVAQINMEVGEVLDEV